MRTVDAVPAGVIRPAQHRMVQRWQPAVNMGAERQGVLSGVVFQGGVAMCDTVQRF